MPECSRKKPRPASATTVSAKTSCRWRDVRSMNATSSGAPDGARTGAGSPGGWPPPGRWRPGQVSRPSRSRPCRRGWTSRAQHALAGPTGRANAAATRQDRRLRRARWRDTQAACPNTAGGAARPPTDPRDTRPGKAMPPEEPEPPAAPDQTQKPEPPAAPDQTQKPEPPAAPDQIQK